MWFVCGLTVAEHTSTGWTSCVGFRCITPESHLCMDSLDAETQCSLRTVDCTDKFVTSVMTVVNVAGNQLACLFSHRRR